ncbi:hypothetical protein HDF26_004350 [Pedobacter cryoconitis]|nr:hypothetical protein [Pedobacter cryoconitis]MBB6273877.1 hypothetical protein [Pedobacter cryoconitis]
MVRQTVPIQLHVLSVQLRKLGSVKSIGITHSTFTMAEIKNSYNISF